MPIQRAIRSFRQLQNQARELHRGLLNQIRLTEAELNRLREEEQRLAAVLHGGVAVIDARSARGRRVQRGRRLDWKALVAKVPREFQAADLRKLPELAERRASELFAGITRWIEGGLVKRKKKGVYMRVA